MTRRATSSGGFTLIEILVAMAIFSMIAVMVFESFNGVLSAGKGVTESAELLQTARFIVWRFTDDIKNAATLNHSPNARFYGKTIGDKDRREGMISFPGFGRRGFFADAGSDQAEISWEVRENKDNKLLTLIRSENPYVADPEKYKDRAETADITENIVSFEIRFFVNGQWTDNFDSKDIKTPPEAVELNFAVEGSNGATLRRTALVTVGGKL